MSAARARSLFDSRRWSVGTRLSLVSTVAATVGLLGASTAAYVVTRSVLYGQIDDGLTSAMSSVGARPGGQFPEPPETVLCDTLDSADAPAPGQFTMELVKPDGSTCKNPSVPGVQLDESDVELPGGSEITLSDGVLSDGHAARIASTRAEGSAGSTLLLARDIQGVLDVLGILKLTLLGVTVLGALVALALSRWTTRAGLRPITRFTRLAEEIADRGRVDDQLIASAVEEQRGNGDELDRLAHAFTTMTAALSDAEERQRRLVADAGHELRTPLSSLRANVDLLRRSRRSGRELSPDDEEQLLDDLAEQTRELSGLVDGLSGLADDRTGRSQFTTVRLDSCVEAALGRVRTRVDGHELRAEIESVTVLGDETDLERAALNLLDNAVKFSPAGSVVDVDLTDGLLTVSDRGSGIAEKDASRAFERFWRSPRARALPGSGLGLAIVRDTAERHGGWATLRPRLGGGTVASLYVPPLETTPEDL